jgi:putative salt-induced outer membrane protein
MFKVFSLALVSFSVLVSGSAFAQTVVAPATEKVAAPPAEFEGTAEVSSLVTNGNTKNQTTGLSFDVTYRPDVWLVNLKSKYLTTVSQEALTQESFEISGRGGRKVSENGDTYIEHTYLKNQFAGVNNRYVTSAGYGYMWVQSDLQTFRTEAALGYTHEDRTDNTKLAFMSGVLGVVYKYKLTATADIEHETKYLPNFDTSEDWRLTTVTSLSAAISSMFSSKISWKYEHVNLPPLGKIKGDTTTTISLLAKF